MINAIEARNKAKIRLDEIVSSQLQKIEELVLNACEAGYFYASYDFALKEETEKALVDLGYNFKDEEDSKVIEWEFIDSEDNNPIQEEEFFFSNDDEVSVEDDVDNNLEEKVEVHVEEPAPIEVDNSDEEVVAQDETESSAEEVSEQDETESFTFEDYSDNKEDAIEAADSTGVIE